MRELWGFDDLSGKYVVKLWSAFLHQLHQKTCFIESVFLCYVCYAVCGVRCAAVPRITFWGTFCPPKGHKGAEPLFKGTKKNTKNLLFWPKGLSDFYNLPKCSQNAPKRSLGGVPGRGPKKVPKMEPKTCPTDIDLGAIFEFFWTVLRI